MPPDLDAADPFAEEARDRRRRRSASRAGAASRRRAAPRAGAVRSAPDRLQSRRGRPTAGGRGGMGPRRRTGRYLQRRARRTTSHRGRTAPGCARRARPRTSSPHGRRQGGPRASSRCSRTTRSRRSRRTGAPPGAPGPRRRARRRRHRARVRSPSQLAVEPAHVREQVADPYLGRPDAGGVVEVEQPHARASAVNGFVIDAALNRVSGSQPTVDDR